MCPAHLGFLMNFLVSCHLLHNTENLFLHSNYFSRRFWSCCICKVFPGKITVHINMKGCKESQLCLASLFLDMKSPIFSQEMSVNPECERVFFSQKATHLAGHCPAESSSYNSLLKIVINAPDFRSQAPSYYTCACSWLQFEMASVALLVSINLLEWLTELRETVYWSLPGY